MNSLLKTALATAIITASSASIAATDCNARHDEHNISYNYVSSNPGDLITINDVDYRIIRMPFVEFGSDKRFYVQYPQKVASYERFALNTYHDISEPEGCINLEMAGERVNVQIPSTIKDRRSISSRSQTRVTKDYSNQKVYKVLIDKSTLSSSAKIIFRVGETRLSVAIFTSVEEQSTEHGSTLDGSELGDSTPYDFTDNFDYNKMIDGTTTQAVDDLLDYVTIGTF
jgi:hypothetical protein